MQLPDFVENVFAYLFVWRYVQKPDYYRGWTSQGFEMFEWRWSQDSNITPWMELDIQKIVHVLQIVGKELNLIWIVLEIIAFPV